MMLTMHFPLVFPAAIPKHPASMAWKQKSYLNQNPFVLKLFSHLWKNILGPVSRDFTDRSLRNRL